MKSSMIQGQCVQLPIIHTRSIGTKISHSLSLSLLFYFLLVHKVDGYAHPHNHSFQITRVVVVV